MYFKLHIKKKLKIIEMYLFTLAPPAGEPLGSVCSTWSSCKEANI